jgi:hypothetical protein
MKPPSDNERGQAIIVLAFMMIALLAFAALAIDGGNAYVERRRAQNAADAAALAGARQIWLQQSNPLGPLGSSSTTLLEVINQAAQSNGISAGPDLRHNPNVVAYYTKNFDGTEINPNQIGLSGIPSGVTGVRVQATRRFSTFVGGFLNQSPVASARATAVIIPPSGCGDWAIYVMGTHTCSPTDAEISGGGQGIIINEGGVYSNGSLKCDTTKSTIVAPNVWRYNGQLSGDLGQQCVDGQNGNTVEHLPADPPDAWNFNDFLPGGPVASALGGNYHYITGDLTSFPNGDGLYFVEGNVSIPPHTIQRVTVVASGEIQGSGSSDLRAYYSGLLFFSNASSTSVGAVRLTGSEVVWQGQIYAPNGSVDMHAAKNLTMGGSIYTLCANLSGAGIKITYDRASCVPQRATIKLLQ